MPFVCYCSNGELLLECGMFLMPNGKIHLNQPKFYQSIWQENTSLFTIHSVSSSLCSLDLFIITKFLSLDDCGDHVVVINTREIALRGDEWKKRVYFHHTGYPGGASWTLAWEVHQKDPTMVGILFNSSPFEFL